MLVQRIKVGELIGSVYERDGNKFTTTICVVGDCPGDWIEAASFETYSAALCSLLKYLLESVASIEILPLDTHK